mgnify:CR=1 FL=1
MRRTEGHRVTEERMAEAQMARNHLARRLPTLAENPAFFSTFAGLARDAAGLDVAAAHPEAAVAWLRQSARVSALHFGRVAFPEVQAPMPIGDVEIGALAGFEKSGHYFLAEPIGRGYDCGMRVAVEVCKLMDRNPGLSMADLRRALPRTWATPTMSPYCPDGEKYGVVTRLTARIEAMAAAGAALAGQPIERVVTVNGARVMLANGAWGLIRASSNTPNLVVVCESPASEAEMRAIFTDLDTLIRAEPSVGAYDQTI